jgi:hypothetical protein
LAYDVRAQRTPERLTDARLAAGVWACGLISSFPSKSDQEQVLSALSGRLVIEACAGKTDQLNRSIKALYRACYEERIGIAIF